MFTYFVYIMTNKSRTTLYFGVTNHLTRRVLQHREGAIDGFTSRYNCNRLLFFERFDDPSDAIRREKQLKGWRREKKHALISTMNPDFGDLAVTALGLPSAPTTRWEDRQGLTID